MSRERTWPTVVCNLFWFDVEQVAKLVLPRAFRPYGSKITVDVVFVLCFQCYVRILRKELSLLVCVLIFILVPIKVFNFQTGSSVIFMSLV